MVIIVKTLRLVVSIVVVLALLGMVIPVFGQSYSAGERDGQRDGANDAGMATIFWGFLFGVFNVGYVALTAPPECPGRRVMLLEGKPFEYKQGYIDGYKKGRQRQRLLYSALGAGVAVVVVLAGSV